LLPEGPNGSGQRDFGHNGSYLVFRQLRQDVAGFWRTLDAKSRATDGGQDPAACIALAAKMVGRWPSGAPLVKTPHRDDPAMADDDRFLYYGADPHGFNCPLGSHIRRTNPRDALDPNPGSQESIEVGKRHRILRRGRAYGHPESGRRCPRTRAALHLLQYPHRAPVRVHAAYLGQQPEV
jgi:deferrochelatase/peroxidase EfeB